MLELWGIVRRALDPLSVVRKMAKIQMVPGGTSVRDNTVAAASSSTFRTRNRHGERGWARRFFVFGGSAARI
jgi:hypothetical protein